MFALIFGLSTAGCPDGHLGERAVNATIGAGHQAALEQCLSNLDKDLLAGKPDDVAWKNYQDCADEAEPGK